MSAYVIVEFTVKDPDLYRDKYGPKAGQTAKEHGGGVAMDARFSLLDGLPS
jgi:uncharacterized protein (DUF1330 family)